MFMRPRRAIGADRIGYFGHGPGVWLDAFVQSQFIPVLLVGGLGGSSTCIMMQVVEPVA